ncbi:Thiol-disulfide isomerase and thioredoxins-like protein [Shewanella sediminis HAW-EB3]|uniref:Thiol-disulfide isomerase and thioredoxins-like protein n=1 Tax=Shewanella sediminis (strain HAW-EB3) TaxID=425104 RepID=A8G0D2_SHESH|nr:TlpA disulfide reductase family protein [Shewanella sediminis]ABV38555.1 Thiol-disulfide isomerase and thioredoxins-like protein [Shewanella sediminis HAW-EB3]
MRRRIKKFIKNRPFIASAAFLMMSLGHANPAVASAKKIKLYEPKSRQVAPKLHLNDLQGETYSLNSHEGEVRIINFWSSWCGPCIKEMPSLSGLHKEFKGDGLQVVAVAVGESLHDVRAFKQTSGINLPMLVDEDKAASDDWGVFAVPISYIIDQKGYIAARVVGEYDWESDEMKQLLNKVSQEPGSG